jgi:hypothetical protein
MSIEASAPIGFSFHRLTALSSRVLLSSRSSGSSDSNNGSRGTKVEDSMFDRTTESEELQAMLKNT